jgi:hypothetical protein
MDRTGENSQSLIGCEVIGVSAPSTSVILPDHAHGGQFLLYFIQERVERFVERHRKGRKGKSRGPKRCAGAVQGVVLKAHRGGGEARAYQRKWRTGGEG